jgi:hypothetical protein
VPEFEADDDEDEDAAVETKRAKLSSEKMHSNAICLTAQMSPERALSIESIQEEARRMRAVLASIRAFATTRLSPAALLPERILPMSEMRLSYGTERVRDTNNNRFDWKAHLDALDAAVDADEAAALVTRGQGA